MRNTEPARGCMRHGWKRDRGWVPQRIVDETVTARRPCYAEDMNDDGTQTCDGRSMQAAAVASARLEICRNGRRDRWDRLHYVGEFMDSPGSLPVAAIITSLHRMSLRLGRRISGFSMTQALASVTPAMDALIDDIIAVVADAGEHHWDPDHTLIMIGSTMLGPSTDHGPSRIDERRTAAPFPWTDDDAMKAALAIPEAASISMEYLIGSAVIARIDDSVDFGQRIRIGDIPAVFPVAVSKGFNMKWLTPGPEKMNADDESRVIRIMFRLRGDWRPGIYDFIHDDPPHYSRGKEHLLSYLRIRPATYGADWILSIINHINDHDLDKAAIISNPETMRTLISGHASNRGEHESILYDDGLHDRCFDIEPVCETTRSHDGIITGLAVHPGCETDPAALEMVFRILDSMSVGMEERLAGDMRDADGHAATRLIVEAVHDMTDGMPVSYVAETLSSRMSMAAEGHGR